MLSTKHGLSHGTWSQRLLKCPQKLVGPNAKRGGQDPRGLFDMYGKSHPDDCASMPVRLGQWLLVGNPWRAEKQGNMSQKQTVKTNLEIKTYKMFFIKNGTLWFWVSVVNIQVSQMRVPKNGPQHISRKTKYTINAWVNWSMYSKRFSCEVGSCSHEIDHILGKAFAGATLNE